MSKFLPLVAVFMVSTVRSQQPLSKNILKATFLTGGMLLLTEAQVWNKFLIKLYLAQKHSG